MATCAAVSMTTPEGATDEVLEIKNCATSSYRLANVISIAGQYTFSVWAKAASSLNVEFKVLGAVFTEAITTSWRKVVFTVDESTDTNIDISPASNTTLYLYKGMLQSGQYDTDWKPAPEDMATSEELSEQVSSVRSEITQTAEEIRLEVTEVKNGVDEANAAIEELPGKINLSVSNGQLGSKASIKLSVDGTESTAEIDMTKARQAFANDTSSVTVSGGTVTFQAGTLLINAGNFTLDKSGNIVAKNGQFTGTVNATAGTIGPLTVTSSTNTNATSGHTYQASIHTQAYNLSETVWDATTDGATKTVSVDMEFGIRNPGTSTLNTVVQYLVWKKHGDAWSNDIRPYFVTGRGRIKCSGIQIFPNRAVDDNDGTLSYYDDELACAWTDNTYLYLNQIKFVGSGGGAVASDFDPQSSNTYDMGGSDYYWRRIYVGTVYRSSESNLSDRKRKKDIRPLTDDYKSLVMHLQPVSYRWRDGDTRTHAGFVAQDVAAAVKATVGDLAAYQAVRQADDVDVSTAYENIPDADLQWYYSPDELFSPVVGVVQEHEKRLLALEKRLMEVLAND